MKNWLTFGMSAYETEGFHDTSRLITQAFSGSVQYIEPPKPFRSWRTLDGTLLRFTAKTVKGVGVLTPPLPVPRKIDPLRLAIRLQARSLDRQLRQTWGPRWRDDTVVYVTNWTPEFEPMISMLKPKHLVFDLVDDVLSFPYAWNAERVTQAWRRLAAQARAVIAVSPYLVQQAATKLGVQAEWLPNGVDTERFQRPVEKAPQRIQPEGIKVGFAGTMNHWIDFATMAEMSDAFPDVHLYLMGRTGRFGDVHHEATYQDLLSRKNVTYLGPVLYDELPGYLKAMDMLLIPRLPSESSKASSPLKLYEYLAVGKPIVTIGVPIPEDLGHCVYTAESVGGFREAITEALREVRGELPSQSAQRKALAQGNTWQGRIERIEDLLK